MKFVLTIIFGSLIVLMACSTVPDADEIISQAEQKTGGTNMVGAHGPLSRAGIQKILDGTDASDALQRHLAVEQAISETPLTTDNFTRLLRDGEQTFAAMFAAMEGARDHINLEYYILEDIEHEGVSLSDLLIRKQSQGVSVNIIYDSFGSSSTPAEFFERLEAAGVKVLKFNPLNPLEAKVGYTINDRNHRKIMLVDGSIAIVGGVNLSKTYLPQLGKSAAPPGGKDIKWRDTDLEIRGPAVAFLEELFIEHWREQKGPPLNQGTFFPKSKDKGSEIVRVIGSAPDDEIPRYYVTLLSAIRSASENIWLTASYFVPTEHELEDLIDAARRGVDVRLLIPSESDSAAAVVFQRSHYDDLLKAGVKIYEAQNIFLHSKTVVIDGVWSVIGSSNIDPRSIIFNDEIDVVVLGEKTGEGLEQMFLDDIAIARKIDPQKWANRPLTEKLKQEIQPLWLGLIEKYL